MKNSNFVKFGGILLVLLALAALVGSSLTFAQDNTPDSDDAITTPEDGSAEDVTPGFGRFGHHGMGRGLIDRDAARELLAQELGVTVEALAAAHAAARETISAENGRPHHDQMRALVAQELGVTVAELEAAQTAVQEAMMAQLVEDGVVTQAQLDDLLGMKALRGLAQDIFSREDARVVIAEQLGLTVEELVTARDEGTRIPELAEEHGVDLEALMTAVAEARTAAFEQAVADGRLTQEQADVLLSHSGPHFGFGGHGGRGMHGGQGGHRGPCGGGFGPGSSNGNNGSSTNSSDSGA